MAAEKAGCIHTNMITEGEHNCATLKEFTWVNTVIGNVKTAMTELITSSAKNTCRATLQNSATDLISASN
ncbi:hypothetical protein AU255_14175 [Methyloprofundus sedimenti]|uniref:Uncharacterized protein n=1 Tax=Methyloprofundus sedimenti TaxID=1420851 RepID=A0A1V8M3U7_9GAMM|nr:hypothetical protein AU255_14175 [Methyloprofundus sedimenti]